MNAYKFTQIDCAKPPTNSKPRRTRTEQLDFHRDETLSNSGTSSVFIQSYRIVVPIRSKMNHPIGFIVFADVLSSIAASSIGVGCGTIPYNPNVNGTCRYTYSGELVSHAYAVAYCEHMNGQLGPRIATTGFLTSIADLYKNCGDIHTAYEYDKENDNVQVGDIPLDQTSYTWRDSARPSKEKPIIIAYTEEGNLILYPDTEESRHTSFCVEDPCKDRGCSDQEQCYAIAGYCGYTCRSLPEQQTVENTERAKSTESNGDTQIQMSHLMAMAAVLRTMIFIAKLFFGNET